jgi:phosphomevalonate kinase
MNERGTARPSDADAGVLATRAPGKAMLFGEYAVLEGAPAIVAAVDRYVTAVPTATPPRTSGSALGSPFVREARAALERARAERGLPPISGGVRVDSAPLYVEAGGRKLGLGSSAAVVVAVFGIPRGMSEAERWLACEGAHAQAQGSRGSGADLAAAIWGGVLRFVPATEPGQAPSVQPITLEPGIEVTLVDSGLAASTGDRLARLAELRRRDPVRHAVVQGPLTALARQVADEVSRSGRIPVEALEAWNAALGALGDAVGLPIRTPALDAIAEAAREAGGAGKPSGAGGGDLAVCFVPTDGRERLRAALERRGFGPLSIHVGGRGCHLVPAPDSSSPRLQRQRQGQGMKTP